MCVVDKFNDRPLDNFKSVAQASTIWLQTGNVTMERFDALGHFEKHIWQYLPASAKSIEYDPGVGPP